MIQDYGTTQNYANNISSVTHEVYMEGQNTKLPLKVRRIKALVT